MVFFTILGGNPKVRSNLLSVTLSGLGAGLIMASSGCAPAMIVEEVAPSQMPAASASQPSVPAPRVAQAPSPAQQEKLPQPTIKETALEVQPFRLQELSVLEENGQTTLRIKFSAPVAQYRHFSLTQPSRIVLDIFGDAKRQAQVENFRVETHWLSLLRVTSGEGYLRLVMEIAAASVPAYVAEPDNGGLKVLIGPVNPQLTGRKELQLVQGGKRVDVSVVEAKPVAPSAGAQVPEAKAEAVAKPAVGEDKKYTGQRISLDFKDADIKNVFRLLAEVSGRNLVVTGDVQRRVTLRLVDVPWDQALELLIDTNGLGKEEIGNVIRISSTEQLRRESDARAGVQKAKENEQPLETSYLSVNYATVKELLDKVKPALTPRGTLVADDRSNTIIVRDIRKGIEGANEIVSRLDTRTPQVQIESNLIETTPSFARALGFQLAFDAPIHDNTVANRSVQLRAPFPAGAPAAGLAPFFNVIQNRLGAFRNVTATLSAAESEGNIKIISRPSIVTLNNVPSTIQSLRILRITLPSGTSSTAVGTGAAAGVTVATERINVGITLTVKPQVSSDGFVLMNISVKSSSIATNTLGGTVVPFDELSREALSNVLVRDGETIVIGGIMKDTASTSESGIPFLKDIPIFGWFFKNARWQKDFEELMVFITPRIISGASENLPTAEQLWRQQLKTTEGN